MYGFLLLVSIPAAAVAFTAGPTAFVARRPLLVLSDSAAEEYLAGCLDKWDEVEKELVNLKAEAKLSGDELVRISAVTYTVFMWEAARFSHLSLEFTFMTGQSDCCCQLGRENVNESLGDCSSDSICRNGTRFGSSFHL